MAAPLVEVRHLVSSIVIHGVVCVSVYGCFRLIAMGISIMGTALLFFFFCCALFVYDVMVFMSVNMID